jgi:hypothetical protein
VPLPADRESLSFMDLSPAGDCIAVPCSERVVILRVSDGRAIDVVPVPSDVGLLTRAHYSSDGALVAAVVDQSPEYEIRVFRLADKSLVARIKGVGSHFFNFDARVLAIRNDDGTLELHDLPSGKLVRALVPKALALSASGERAALMTESGIVVIATESGELLRRVKVDGTMKWATLDGDGERLAIGYDDGRVDIWEIAP